MASGRRYPVPVVLSLHPIVRTLLQWIVARNRPWLWFNGGSGIVYTADGTPKNGFLGGGEVSAYARKIVRVGLRDARGELAEDRSRMGWSSSATSARWNATVCRTVR